MNARKSLRRGLVFTALLAPALLPALARAQTGVSDDRVSLPDGPGSLEGIGDNALVNPNMGAMSYSVDIELPAGFAGATPSLALSYSSSSGSSVVGIGWSMSLPYIERMTSRGLPEYTRDDLFVADGGDQLVLSADADADSPVYRSRYESGFVRYTWLDAGAGAEGSWKAERPDGSVSSYGATADGQAVDSARFFALGGTFRYLLTSTVDVYGHEVRYTYGAHGVVPLVERIEYLFDAAGTARHVVTFDYDDARQDKISDARSGSNELLESRLTGLRITTGGAQVRRYALDYEEYDAAGGFSRLASVKTFGANDGLYPITPAFEYQQGLGALCAQADCGAPKLYEMGNVAAGVATGRASLIDINGDALPDLIDASVENAAHRFYLNRYDPSTGSNTFDPQPVESALGDSGAFPLGSRNVQMLDFNGDGLSDLLNAQDRTVLINRGRPGAQGRPDWARLDAMAANGDLPSFANGNIRYIDYDADRRIDLITSTSDSTIIYRNDGQGGFPQADGVAPIGLGFAEDGLELEDMNGDGLTDPVVKRPNEVRYRLNLGRGKWSGETVVENVTLSAADLEFADLEDINGDSLTDLVVVVGGEVRYQLNRNGKRFDDVVTLSSLLEGSIPVRNQSVAVLYADMNGNGSDDIVWVTEAGQVSYLEMFPVRPNLLSRVTNGIGMVTTVSYGTSVAEQARDGGAGSASWPTPLPNSMLLVTSIDTYAEQAIADDIVHDYTEYTYGGGFYDGDEKQFRGYSEVDLFSEGDETQASKRQMLTYEVGSDDPYRFGRALRSVTLGGTDMNNELPLTTVENDYADCEIAGLERMDERFPVRSICRTETRELLQEQQPESEWKTLVTRTEYDGYGQVTRESALGVDGEDGDERYTETEYIEPGSSTAGKWILGKPKRVVEYGDPANKATLFHETKTYYDAGDAPFMGLPAGKLTNGAATRTERRVAEGEYVQALRRTLNADGMDDEALDANGSPDDLTGHRTSLDWDLNLLVRNAATTSDATGSYDLVRRYAYDPIFQRPAEVTDWTVQIGGAPVGEETRVVFHYDEFGRLSAKGRAPFDDSKPEQHITYELSSPVSKSVEEIRTVRGGPADVRTIRCLDGLGRTLQTRFQIESGQYLVDGYKVYNRQGQIARAFQPFTSEAEACDTSASRIPAGTLFQVNGYDAEGRNVSMTNEDGTRLRTDREPLRTLLFEEDDVDETHPNFNTPRVTVEDGLGRVVSHGRALSPAHNSETTIEHDDLGRPVRVMDAAGNLRTQAYDGLDRVVRVATPNAGEMTFEYDAAGNQIRRVDPVTTQVSRYDGRNRLIEAFDAGDEAGTKVTLTYDRLADCAACTHLAGRTAVSTYPLGADAIGDPIGIVRMGYDERGNATYRSNQWEGVAFETRSQYDQLNRMLERTYPDGQVERHTYDGASRLIGVEGLVTGVEYDARGLIASIKRENGVVETMGYDERQRFVSKRVDLNGKTLFGFDATLDVEGTLRELADTATERAGRPSYGVKIESDAWHRPLKATFTLGDDSTEVVTSTFDDLDNVVSVTSTGAGDLGDLAYDASHPNQVVTAAGLTYAYDAAGRLTGRGDTRYVRDWRGGLARVQREGHPDEVSIFASRNERVMKLAEGGVTYSIGPDFEVRDGVSARYTRVGGRVARTMTDALAAKVLSDLAPGASAGATFTPAGDGHIDAGDAWIAQAIAAGVVELSSGVSPSPVSRLLRASARRLLLDDGDETVHLHADRLRSIVLATGADGAVVGERSFGATGVQRESAGFVDVYGFSGQEQESQDDGLIRFSYRNLDAATGRWDAPDPLFAVLTDTSAGQFGQATTDYAFVGNGGFDKIDPTGLGGGEGVKGKVKAAARQVADLAHPVTAKVTKLQALKRFFTRKVKNKIIGKIRGGFDEFDAPTLEDHVADIQDEGAVESELWSQKPGQQLARKVFIGGLKQGVDIAADAVDLAGGVVLGKVAGKVLGAGIGEVDQAVQNHMVQGVNPYRVLRDWHDVDD